MILKNSNVLYKEYNRVFSGIEKNSRKQLSIEKKVLAVLLELEKMSYQANKIENEGKSEKIEKFNDKYIKLTIKLRQLYDEYEKN